MMMDRQRKRAEISLDTYKNIDMSLSEFKEYLDGLATEIGATDETANVFIEYESGYYDESGSITAYVWREETDEECVAREARERSEAMVRSLRYQQEAERRERDMLAALKAKYEAPRSADG